MLKIVINQCAGIGLSEDLPYLLAQFLPFLIQSNCKCQHICPEVFLVVMIKVYPLLQ